MTNILLIMKIAIFASPFRQVLQKNYNCLKTCIHTIYFVRNVCIDVMTRQINVVSTTPRPERTASL